MGMTKARVFPLPVTCGRGTRAWSARPRGSLRREGGGGAVRTRTHRFGRDVLVSQEERDGGGLEGRRQGTGRRAPAARSGAAMQRVPAARSLRSPPAPAPAGPSSPGRAGTCTGVMYGKPSSRSAPSTRGCSGTGSDSQDPSVTCSIASPAAASGTPAADTSASGRRPVRPGTALGLRSSGERKGVLAAGDREAH